MRLIVEVHLADNHLEQLAAGIAEHLERAARPVAEAWLDVIGAGAHLGLTENSIRALVKRNEIPVYRTENGRLRFSVTELDDWVRTGSCATAPVDLP
jgi:hypothetical protein